jgi:phosphatidylglycerophosphatase A
VNEKENFVNSFLLWLAQGFGIGRVPKAPGTFGSVVGLAWFALLLLAGNAWGYVFGCLVGLALSVWLCGVGEKFLQAKDPGSVVFDEIAAIPICFLGWVAVHLWRTGSFPTPEFFFSKPNWLPTLGVFAAFRFFDVLKPWPVSQSQSLPGGWGVTVDDALAAVYVNVVVLAALFFFPGG